MGETIRLGRIRGISIGVSWTVVVIVGLLMWSLATVTLPDSAPGYTDGVYWTVGLLAAIGLMAAILAHEVSHAIVATRSGVHVDSITLWMFGGLARLSGQSRDAGTELRIALAGPAMSVAIGASCLVVAGLSSAVGGPELLTAAVTWLGVVNLVLAVFNLLPGAPLDGGRVLAAVVWVRDGVGINLGRMASRPFISAPIECIMASKALLASPAFSRTSTSNNAFMMIRCVSVIISW